MTKPTSGAPAGPPQLFAEAAEPSTLSPMRQFTTTEQAAWIASDAAFAHPAADDLLLVVGPPGPPLLGWGGCFNEIGADQFFRLGEAERHTVLDALFSDNGCGFSFCRIPVGANDYSLDWYSHADRPEDYALEHFSIERDRRLLLPYLHEARKVRPELTFFASPWSPPAWMKVRRRYNGSSLRPDPAVLATYAAYLRRFVDEYRAEGIPITQMHVQNEPNSDQKFPSCLWTGESMRDFIRDHLGPRFEGSGCEIWAGTIERGAHLGWQTECYEGDRYQNWAHTILSDPGARRYVGGIGYQWNGKGALAQTRASWPDLPMIQTESECGNGDNSWTQAFYTFDLMWQYFRFGCSAYVGWNMLLPDDGESTWGWRQNAMISAHDGKPVFNPEYHVLRHVAAAVRPGARCLPLVGPPAALSLLFENSDGTRAPVLANPFSRALSASVPTLQGTCGLSFAARSFTTVIAEKEEGLGGDPDHRRSRALRQPSERSSIRVRSRRASPARRDPTPWCLKAPSGVPPIGRAVRARYAETDARKRFAQTSH